MKIVHRYILREYLLLFFLCALAFGILSIGNFLFNINDFLVGRRTPVGLVLTLVGYRFPMLVLDVAPAAVLFGIVLSVGRLARDRELDVLRNSGWSLTRIAVPLLTLTLVLSTLVFVWYDAVVPACNQAYMKKIRKLQFQDIIPLINENVFVKGPGNQYFYIRRVNNSTGQLEGVMVFETNLSGYPRIITAETGRMVQRRWELQNGIVHELDQKGWVRFEVGFERMVVDAGDDLSKFIGNQLTTEEMTRKDLKQYIERYGKSGFDVSAFAVEYYMKTAIPYASVILALIALPFTCLLSRRGWIWGVIFSFLLILAYFFLQVVFRSFGQNHVISPWLAAWGPNMIFIVIGGGLLYKVRR